MNGEVWNDFDKDFYMTDANVDYAMKFIDNSVETGKPFFHYIAFNAPHYPLQAPKEDIEKYLGRYDAGWEALREERFEKQKRLGMFPKNMELPKLPHHMKSWDSLSKKGERNGKLSYGHFCRYGGSRRPEHRTVA